MTPSGTAPSLEPTAASRRWWASSGTPSTAHCLRRSSRATPFCRCRHTRRSIIDSSPGTGHDRTGGSQPPSAHNTQARAATSTSSSPCSVGTRWTGPGPCCRPPGPPRPRPRAASRTPAAAGPSAAPPRVAHAVWVPVGRPGEPAQRPAVRHQAGAAPGRRTGCPPCAGTPHRHVGPDLDPADLRHPPRHLHLVEPGEPDHLGIRPDRAAQRRQRVARSEVGAVKSQPITSSADDEGWRARKPSNSSDDASAHCRSSSTNAPRPLRARVHQQRARRVEEAEPGAVRVPVPRRDRRGAPTAPTQAAARARRRGEPPRSAPAPNGVRSLAQVAGPERGGHAPPGPRASPSHSPGPSQQVAHNTPTPLSCARGGGPASPRRSCRSQASRCPPNQPAAPFDDPVDRCPRQARPRSLISARARPRAHPPPATGPCGKQSARAEVRAHAGCPGKTQARASGTPGR